LFTAGEPTLNKDLVALIYLAKKLSYKNIGLITNGRLLSDKGFCQKLLEAGLNEISVSFHGSESKIQEKMTRSKNSFNETLSGIKNLNYFKRVYGFNFYINFTVTKINLKDTGFFIRLVSGFKIDGIVFNVVIPKGRALVNFGKVVPLYSSVSREFNSFLKLLKEAKFSVSISGLPLCLMTGFEEFASNPEKIIIKNPSLNTKADNRIKSVSPWGRKIKSAKCNNCFFNESCTGIWASYVKKRGWGEIKPLTKKKNMKKKKVFFEYCLRA
jgi:MoaA/NifB/PqqE/SkfB family radical SAM enzyme